ncbi:hypothetical protein [Halomonas korlensis]|uniref:hypothetical protein n=1 Tax=Halomonas korlensis TaxID=463301 RepID=UPI00111379DD|nr:hypothetical protein [Halomonas korlensis]
MKRLTHRHEQHGKPDLPERPSAISFWRLRLDHRLASLECVIRPPDMSLTGDGEMTMVPKVFSALAMQNNALILKH